MAVSSTIRVEKIAEASFPTEYGDFRIFGFRSSAPEPEEAVVLRMGDISTPEPVILRIHSECLTGDVFHSLRCDCRAQLDLAIQLIAEAGRGLLIYENQEGRGIGLLNKLRAYELQDLGADTVEANVRLGFEADLRDYSLPAAILRYFEIASVRLLSNNPEKIQAIENAGIIVAERIPAVVPPIASRQDYLRTKREKMGHLI